MKKSIIALILFWIGVFIILISNISLIKYKNNQNILINIFFTCIALSIIISSWTLKNDSETYDDLKKDYNYALTSGRVVGGGSVYSQNPYPGLGWVN
jgi:hypothetical protein